MKPNELQKKLKEDVDMIKRKAEMIIPADKTGNHYAVPYEKYEELLEKPIHKDYKKATAGAFENVTKGDKVIADKRSRYN